MVLCPNKSHKDYKSLVEKVGEIKTFELWNKHSGNIRKINAEANQIAQGSLKQREGIHMDQLLVDRTLEPLIDRITVNGTNLPSVLSRLAAENIDADSKALINALLQKVSYFVSVDFVSHSNRSTENGRYDNGNRKINVYAKNLTLKYQDAQEALLRTVVHEAVHSLVSPRAHLFLQGKDQHLTDSDKQHLSQLHDIYSELKPKADNHYGFSSFPEFLQEVFSNPKMLNTVNDVQPGMFRRIWSAITKFVNDILGIDGSVAKRASDIMGSLVASYNENQENAVQDYLQNVYDYSLTASPITDLKDINVRRNGEVDTDTYEKKEAVKYLRLLNTPGTEAYETSVIKIGNREIDFTGVVSNQDRMDKIIKDIIEPMMELEKNTSSNLVNWLNDGAVAENFENYFPAKSNLGKHFKAIADRISSDHLGFNPVTDKAMLYDSEESKALGYYREGFVGNNPVIVVHGHLNGGDKISMIDITYNQLNQSSKEGLFNFADPTIKQNLAYSSPYKNTELGYRKFCLTAQVMGMKEKNPNLQVKRALVGQLEAPVKGKTYTAPFYSSYLEMNNEVEEIKRLIQSKDLMASLGEVGKVIQNPALHEPGIYKSSYMHFLLNHYKGAAELVNSGLEWDGVSTWRYGEGTSTGKYGLNNLEAAVQKLVDDPIKNKQWMDVLKARLTQIDALGLKDDLREEVKLLSNAILQVKDHLYKGNGVIHDAMAVADVHLTSPQNWRHPVLQSAKRVVEAGYFKINEKFSNWMNEIKEPTKTFNDFLHTKDASLFGKELFTDVSEQRFKGVTKQREFITRSGTKVRRRVLELHTDLNDPETIEAIQLGETTKAEVEYAQVLNRTLKAQMLVNLEEEYIHKHISQYVGAASEEAFEEYRSEAKQHAIDTLKATWKDGVLPVITKTTTELMFSKDVKKGFSKFMSQMTDPNQVFVDFKQEHVRHNSMMGQVMDSTLKEYGKSERLKALGLFMGNDSVVYAEDQDPNEASFDLELTMKYFMMMSLRANEFNKTVLPEINAAKIALASYQADPEVMKNASQTLFLYTERTVHGKSQKLDIGPNETANVNADKMLSGAMRLMPFAAFSWSIPTGISAFVQNYTSLITTSFANRVGGGNLFGPAEAAQASKEVWFNSNKVEALMKFYQIADVSPEDLVNGTRKGFHSEFKSHVFSQHSAQYFSWLPDYSARATVTIAQMIKDGTYDAHIVKDGVVVGYDNSKDKRWTGKNGKELKNYYTKALKEQGLLAEDATEPNRAYDIQGANAIKDISSQKITGGYSTLEQNNLGYGILGRGFKSTRNWIFNKWTNLYQHGFERDSSGMPVFNVETGQMEIQTEFFEGKINSLMRAKDLIMEGYTDADKTVWTNLKSMPGKSKQNLAQLSADTALALIAYFLYHGLTDKDDEDEDLNIVGKLALTRFGKAFAYGAYDLTSEWNPYNVLQSMQSPFAVLPYLKNTLDFGTALLTFDVQSALQKSGRVLPLGSTMVGLTDLFQLENP